MSIVRDIIATNDQIYAYLFRNCTQLPEETTFLTPPNSPQQTGFVVYPANSEIPRHFHKPIPRQINGTTEVLMVMKGKCIIDFYDQGKHQFCSRVLCTGDVIVIITGGHGFRMCEDTVLFEVKQGPYHGADEKERF